MGLRVAACCVVILCFAMPAHAEEDKPFEAIEIRVEGPIWDNVAVAPLIHAGEPALMLLHREEGRHWLTVYNPGETGGWLRPIMRRIAPRADDLFYDIVETGTDSPALIAFLGPEGVGLVDPASGVRIATVAASHLYRGDTNPEFGRLDFAHDVDGDGRDDLLIPDFEGIHLLLQTGEGAFSAPIELDFRPEMRISRFDPGVPSYPRFPMMLSDIDGDGAKDIVFLRGLSLVWFRNLGEGAGFDTQARETVTGLQAVGNRWIDELEAARARASDANFVETRILEAADFNGDGNLDILTETETVRGTFDRDVQHALHYGQRKDGLLHYPENADAGVRIEGFAVRRVFTDLDGDDRRDLVVASVDIGLGKIIGALFSGSTTVDISFFRLGEDDRYPGKPNLDRKTRVDFNFSTGEVEVPVFLTADLSGDGRQDLVLQDGRGKLAVYRGMDDPRLFESRARTFSISLPKDGQLVEAADLDGDGGKDLILRFDPRGIDDIAARDRLILLFSR